MQTDIVISIPPLLALSPTSRSSSTLSAIHSKTITLLPSISCLIFFHPFIHPSIFLHSLSQLSGKGRGHPGQVIFFHFLSIFSSVINITLLYFPLYSFSPNANANSPPPPVGTRPSKWHCLLIPHTIIYPPPLLPVSPITLRTLTFLLSAACLHQHLPLGSEWPNVPPPRPLREPEC